MPVAVLVALSRTGFASEEEEPVSDRPHPIGDPPDDYPVDEPPDDDDDDDDAAGRKRGLAPCPESRRQEVSDASLDTLRERRCGPDCGPAGDSAAVLS